MAMSATTFLRRPGRGTRIVSDVQPGSLDEVGAGIAECLRVKGFCVLSGHVPEDALREATGENGIKAVQEWHQPSLLVQDGLLGMEGSNRIAHVKLTEPSAEPAEATGLQGVDLAMWRLVQALMLHQHELGFRCSVRTAATLHEASFPEEAETDITDQEADTWAGTFVCHKVMALVFLGPTTGTLELQPFDEDSDPAEVTTEPGLAVLLRTDQLAHTYYGKGQTATYVASCFMLQRDVLRMHPAKMEEHLVPAARELNAWINERLREIKDAEPEELDDWEEESSLPRSFIRAANRTYFKQQTVSVRSIACRLPAAWEPDVFFLSLTQGVDLLVQVPFERWDHSEHYDEAPDSWSYEPPKTNSRHASFMDSVDCFDNKFFGISQQEAKGMDPCQRLSLEVTCDGLYKAGYSKGSLLSLPCGMYVGHSQTEWLTAEKGGADVGIYGATGGAASIVAGRLSFCLGCKGASLAIDTEGASSLSAIWYACESVEKKGAGVVQPVACGIGVHMIMSPSMWLTYSTAGRLSAAGRCLAFDAKADGYARSEGIGCAAVGLHTQVVDGEEVVDEEDPALGRVVGGATNNNGKCRFMSAPWQPAVQELLADALARSRITPYDMDLVECHGVGHKCPGDAWEVLSLGKVLRENSDEDPAFEESPLQLSSVKTNVGNPLEMAGLVSFIKTLYGIRWGYRLANVHLFQINPYLVDAGALIFPTEHLEQVERRTEPVFAGVTAFGYGGTNVHLHVYGKVDEDVRPAPEPTPDELRPRISYWPGGGGDLDSTSRPRKGYFITGTFTNWGEALPMQFEGDGSYGYTMTLGENRWEQFQIFIDGSESKVLHPQQYRAPSGTEVFGPDSEETKESTWFIDGRSELYYGQVHPAGRAPGHANGEALDLVGEASQRLVPWGKDVGLPGDQYRIRLHVAGKWRTVTWVKLEGPGPARPALLPQARYSVAGSWSDFSLEDMQPDPAAPGLFFCEVVLHERGARFLIVRNGDWSQTFYPQTETSFPTAAPVCGPEDAIPGINWYLPGRAGDKYRIEFHRSVEVDKDEKKINWRKLD